MLLFLPVYNHKQQQSCLGRDGLHCSSARNVPSKGKHHCSCLVDAELPYKPFSTRALSPGCSEPSSAASAGVKSSDNLQADGWLLNEGASSWGSAIAGAVCRRKSRWVAVLRG